MKGTSGQVVRRRTCNAKIAGSNPVSCFRFYMITWLAQLLLVCYVACFFFCPLHLYSNYWGIIKLGRIWILFSKLCLGIWFMTRCGWVICFVFAKLEGVLCSHLSSLREIYISTFRTAAHSEMDLLFLLFVLREHLHNIRIPTRSGNIL